MQSTTDRIYAIRCSNLSTQQVTIEQERFTLEDAIAIVEIANSTEEAWFYEVVTCFR